MCSVFTVVCSSYPHVFWLTVNPTLESTSETLCSTVESQDFTEECSVCPRNLATWKVWLILFIYPSQPLRPGYEWTSQFCAGLGGGLSWQWPGEPSLCAMWVWGHVFHVSMWTCESDTQMIYSLVSECHRAASSWSSWLRLHSHKQGWLEAGWTQAPSACQPSRSCPLTTIYITYMGWRRLAPPTGQTSPCRDLKRPTIINNYTFDLISQTNSQFCSLQQQLVCILQGNVSQSLGKVPEMGCGKIKMDAQIILDT